MRSSEEIGEERCRSVEMRDESEERGVQRRGEERCSVYPCSVYPFNACEQRSSVKGQLIQRFNRSYKSS